VRRGLVLRRTGSAVRAVDGVSLAIGRGETLALVGESGCGKSTVGRLALRLLDPTQGRVVFDGIDLADLGPEALRRCRRRFQIIFQDPYSSLNPRMTIRDIVAEALVAAGHTDAAENTDKVRTMLETVGLSGSHAGRYPHEFSGGQRQRIGIARALVTRPEFVVCDEAVSALDVSIQGQIVNLLQDLQDEFGVSYLFISHDLGVVRHIARRVAVMYLGRVVEAGETASLYREPRHPYTRALLQSVPSTRLGRKTGRTPVIGEPPSPLDPPSGCHFHPRCPLAFERCRVDAPALLATGDGRSVACHLFPGVPAGVPATAESVP
jgi:oligopeptide/dipeptide ABC transporter ATP-binding protein